MYWALLGSQNISTLQVSLYLDYNCVDLETWNFPNRNRKNHIVIILIIQKAIGYVRLVSFGWGFHWVSCGPSYCPSQKKIPSFCLSLSIFTPYRFQTVFGRSIPDPQRFRLPLHILSRDSRLRYGINKNLLAPSQCHVVVRIDDFLGFNCFLLGTFLKKCT